MDDAHRLECRVGVRASQSPRGLRMPPKVGGASPVRRLSAAPSPSASRAATPFPKSDRPEP